MRTEYLDFCKNDLTICLFQSPMPSLYSEFTECMHMLDLGLNLARLAVHTHVIPTDAEGKTWKENLFGPEKLRR